MLALESADLATVGAVGGQLERSLGISHAELGLLAAAGPLTAVAGTLPAGVLADRVRRTPLLAASVVLWALAMVAGGAAGSFAELLGARAALGVLTATATPVLLSLTGDYFAPGERARRCGTIGAGELLGSGFGFLVSGNVAAVLSWRWSFWVLVPPALVLAVAIHRALPEPPRGREPEGERDGLDVIPARLRGRAESVRSLLRALAFAVAPLAFGLLADAFAGPSGNGPRAAFLIMLAPLAGSGLLLLAARCSYPRDAAGAIASDRRSAPAA